MKIVSKLTVTFILSISLVLGLNGVLRVRREVGLFESDRVRNHEVIVRVLARAALAVWLSDGPKRAIAMIDDLGSHTDKLRIHWHAFGEPQNRAIDEKLARLAPNSTFSFADVPVDGDRGRCIYATLDTPAPLSGAISLCETFAAQNAYVRKTIAETVATTLVLAAVCALLSASLGIWLVGKPVAALSAKALRIGAGDFSEPLDLQRKDELAALARDMNAMCEQLTAAAERVKQETASRMAAVEQLRHADRLTTVGKLASGLAHELGTPLNVIEARADMIASGETTALESAEYARVIRTASERMTRLIRTLLDFARPRHAARAPLRVFALVSRTVEMLGPLAARKHVELVAKDAGADAIILGDADQLVQVLTNLVVNAIQAMSHAGSVAVTVSTEHALPPADLQGVEGNYVCIAVRDEGAGIAAEHLGRIFEPFFTTKDVGSGTGLGLAVAYGIVHEHGGWIDVQTELGKGSSFRVYLPKGAEA